MRTPNVRHHLVLAAAELATAEVEARAIAEEAIAERIGELVGDVVAMAEALRELADRDDETLARLRG